MKIALLVLVAGLLTLAACSSGSSSNAPATHRHPTASNDDREFNIQSRNFKTGDQATGLDATRRFER